MTFLSSMSNSDKKLSNLLHKIQSLGYANGLISFLKDFPDFEYKFKMMEGSIAFRATHEKNFRCLVINSDLGNIPENLSHTYDHVFSLDLNKEKLLIQKYRFQENKIYNITLVRCDSHYLPFPNDYFDLIVSNGIKIDDENTISTKSTIKKYFNEIKRVLVSDGCLCLGVRNNSRLKILMQETENDENSKNFRASFNEYESLLNSSSFKFKSFWVLPSYQKPHYSGNIEDNVSLKWFFKSFQKFSVNTKKFSLFKLFSFTTNDVTRKLFTKLFCPSFLFYCYKNEIPKELEDVILEHSKLKHLIQFVRSRKIMYILLDMYGNPVKVSSCKFTKYNLKEKICPITQNFNKSKSSNEKITIEEWLQGKQIDRLKKNDINLVMSWLIDFQNNTASELFSKNDIEQEIENMKIKLNKLPEMNNFPYHQWLEEYKSHTSDLLLKKTAVHGDLQPKNIFVDQKNSSIKVIDWELSVEKGNPLIDFIWFAISIMQWSPDSINEFKLNLEGKGKVISSIKTIKETMQKSFHADLNFLILLRFVILRWITVKTQEEISTLYLHYIELLKILSDKHIVKNIGEK